MLKTPWRPSVDVSPLFRPRAPKPSELMMSLAWANEEGCCGAREREREREKDASHDGGKTPREKQCQVSDRQQRESKGLAPSRETGRTGPNIQNPDQEITTTSDASESDKKSRVTIQEDQHPHNTQTLGHKYTQIHIYSELRTTYPSLRMTVLKQSLRLL
ncbi:hypothetical protein EYF80_054752 [Liparis tanakae]|uniref:Uncharacterized protein n=1 Tax=Liparis tanakae TaxID=230148 RepID=A0A4Z2F3L6_9TELE|nr:hypothetical protein EYF80_054752 [Liparis tanakae]